MSSSKINKISKINHKHFPRGFKPTILSNKPYIVKLRRFLNTEEIETLLRMAKGKFEHSTIIVDDEEILSTTRTSKTAFITDNGQFEKYSKPVENVLKKVCYLVGCKREQIESLMVVKYKPSQQYYDHWDFFEEDDSSLYEEGGRQRIATFFCYLNSLDIGDGGETEFPKLNIKSKPSKGTAVFWWDTDKKGNVIRETLHRGNPVKRGTKYGLNIWIRERSFN